jgi:hypothetical protein
MEDEELSHGWEDTFGLEVDEQGKKGALSSSRRMFRPMPVE